MSAFLPRRILLGAVLVFATVTTTFVLVSSSAHNVARNLLGESATERQLTQKEAELGLDRPLHVRFIDWFSAALTGDLGTSWFSSEPVASILAARVPVTLSMVGAAMVVTALISVLLGVLAAIRGGALDRTIQIVSVAGFSLPSFWIALVLVLVFAILLPLLPATGYVPFTTSPIEWGASLVLPVTALVIGGVAAAAQQVRGAMIDGLRQDFVRTLRARGLPEWSVVLRHVLRNAASPVLTVLSLQFIGMLGGSVVIERIFAIPGLGTLTADAALRGDAPVLVGAVVVTVIMVVLVNLVVDATATWVSPKARAR